MRFILIGLLVFGCSGGGSGGDDGGDELPLTAVRLDFSAVQIGTPSVRQVDVRNPIGGVTATITGVLTSLGALTPSGLPALPFELDPGQRLTFSVIWEPTAGGGLAETIEVRAAGRPSLMIDVAGEAFEAESIVDLGLVGLVGSETPELSVDIRSDAISFAIEAVGGSRTAPSGGPIFLTSLIGPDGTVYVDRLSPHSGPYVFERIFPGKALNNNGNLPFVPVDFATFHVPNTDQPGAQLRPGGGTYRFRLSNQGGTLAGLLVRVYVERRPNVSTIEGSIPLNVFLAPALLTTAPTAPTDPHVQTILATADSLLRQTGVGLGEIRFFKLTDPSTNTADPQNPGPLVRNSVIASRPWVNVFFVKNVLQGAAGLTAAIPGVKVNGTRLSGLFVLADEFFHPVDLGTVLAHEIAHYLGVGHTTEQPGATPWTEDLITDTCFGAGCFGDPANYLMDPNPIRPGPPIFTPGQAHVMLRNIFVEAAAPTFSAGAPLITGNLAGRERVPLQCATCGHAVVDGHRGTGAQR